MINLITKIWFALKKFKTLIIAGWIIKLLITIVIFAQTTGCNQEYTPKPKAYHKIELPKKNYQQTTLNNCPFSFEYPQYSSIEKDSLFFEEVVESPCWLDISFESLNGVIHLSYKDINNKNDFAEYIEDAHKMTYKHHTKAESIEAKQIQTKNNVGGLIYEVGGDAASAFQFFLTDTNQHFLRGALYFKNTPNADSIAPVVNFVKVDMMHLIETFKWDNI